jgi:hypothetical protein
MHKYAKNMQKICTNMQQYARPRYIAEQAKICKLYAQICINMQYMQSMIPYAEYARICTPHFADEGAGEQGLQDLVGLGSS